MDVAEYCRDIETYLCRKNDGHLIRVVGPSFELVARWANDGVPLKVAFGGIDRYCERYYRKGPRRRPVRIEFCEADVRDVFDEWRRATGVTLVAPGTRGAPETSRRGPSLPEHLERVVRRLTNARATGALAVAADPLIDRLSADLDRTRASAGGVRGSARAALIARLEAADHELSEIALGSLDDVALQTFRQAAADELAAFQQHMVPELVERALARTVDRLARERLGLPVIAFS